MTDAIYLVQNDGKLVEMTATPYDSEPRLQKLLADYPHLLAGSQMNVEKPRRWLLIAQEMGIPWDEGGGDQLSLDHLFLDQDGIPTLVEVKRSTDTRIRREVVGQMLEYAANAVSYWPVEKIRARFEARCQAQGLAADQELATLLDANEDDEPATDLFWQQVRDNLQARRIRMLFVADEIPLQLRRIVEFLNEQMANAEVLAVEVKQYVGSGLQTLVPRLVGQTARKGPDPSPGKQWDEARFFESLRQHTTPAGVEAARRILEWTKIHMPDIFWGRGKADGSFNAQLHHKGVVHRFFGVWSYGTFELQFQYMIPRNTLDSEQRLELLHQINEVLQTKLSDEQVNARPNIPLADIADSLKLDHFLVELEWARQQILANHP